MDNEQMLPKFGLCSNGRIGVVQSLGASPFDPDKWAYLGYKLFPKEDEDVRWCSSAATCRFLNPHDADRLSALIEVDWKYQGLCK